MLGFKTLSNLTFKNNDFFLSWAMSTWETEADESVSSRPAWSTELVPGQPELHRDFFGTPQIALATSTQAHI